MQTENIMLTRPPLKRHKKALRQRHEDFCVNYFSGLSGAESARRAGYSLTTSYVTASRLLKTVNVRARLEELRKDATSASIMTRLEREQRLTEIGRGKLTDFIDEDGNVDIKGGNPGAIQEYIVEEFEGGPDGRAKSRRIKLKLHNPVQAIMEHNKMEGAYKPTQTEENYGKAFAELLGRLHGYQEPAKLPDRKPYYQLNQAIEAPQTTALTIQTEENGVMDSP